MVREPLVIEGRGPRPRTVLVYGNCQIEALAHGLAALEGLNDDYRFVVLMRTSGEAAEWVHRMPREWVDSACLLLEQYENPAMQHPLGRWLHEQIPPGCEVIRFPSFLLNSPWPFECVDPRVDYDERLTYGRYLGDLVALQVVGMGLRGADAMAAYLELSERKMPNLQVRLERDFHRMRHYDTACDVQVGDYVEQNYRTQHLFVRSTNVSSAGTAELVARIAQAASHVLGARPRLPGPGEAIQDTSALQLPIHPLVAQRLDLSFWQPLLRYRWYGQAWTFEEYYERYFENDRSW